MHYSYMKTKINLSAGWSLVQTHGASHTCMMYWREVFSATQVLELQYLSIQYFLLNCTSPIFLLKAVNSSEAAITQVDLSIHCSWKHLYTQLCDCCLEVKPVTVFIFVLTFCSLVWTSRSLSVLQWRQQISSESLSWITNLLCDHHLKPQTSTQTTKNIKHSTSPSHQRTSWIQHTDSVARRLQQKQEIVFFFVYWHLVYSLLYQTFACSTFERNVLSISYFLDMAQRGTCPCSCLCTKQFKDTFT